MAAKQRLADEFKLYVTQHNGTLLEEFKFVHLPIKVSCSSGHEFLLSYKDLKENKWCEQCNQSNSAGLFRLLDQLKLEYTRNYIIPGLEAMPYTAFIEKDDGIIIDYDPQECFEPTSEELHRAISEKTQIALDNFIKVIRVNDNILGVSSNASKYLTKALTSIDLLCLPDNYSYDWLQVALPSTEININSEVPIAPKLKIIEQITGLRSGFDNFTEPDELRTSLHHWNIERIGPRSYIKVNIAPWDGKKLLAVGYTRVSSHDQIGNNSLTDQEKYILARAEGMKMYVRAIYTDQGISGAKIENRPAMTRLLQDIKIYENFVAYHISRLSRTSDDLKTIMNKVVRNGAATLIAGEIVVSRNDPQSIIMYEVMAVMAEQERQFILERVGFTMAGLMEEGKLKHKPRFGWKSLGPKLPLVENEEEQLIIREIRKLSTEEGVNDTEISRRLDERGYKNKGKKFTPDRVRTIRLQNNIERIRKHTRPIS